MAALGYSVRGAIYKLVVKNGFTNNISQIAYRLFSIPISVCLLLLNSKQLYTNLNLKLVLYFIFIVVSTFIADKYYYRSIEKTGISFVSIISKCAPIFSIIISYLFLGESLNNISLLGILLIVSASVWTSKTLNSSNLKLKNKKAVIDIIKAQLLYTINSYIMKEMFEIMGAINFILYFSLLLLVPLFIKARKTKSLNIFKKNLNLKSTAILFLFANFSYIPFIANVNAIGRIMLPVAFALTSFSLIFTILLGYAFLGEKENLKEKVMAILGMLLGGYLTLT